MSPSPEALRAAVLRVLGEIAPEADLEALEPSWSLREELDLDSMDFLRFVRGVYDALGVDVPELDYGQLDSLASAVAYLARRLDATPRP